MQVIDHVPPVYRIDLETFDGVAVTLVQMAKATRVRVMQALGAVSALVRCLSGQD